MCGARWTASAYPEPINSLGAVVVGGSRAFGGGAGKVSLPWLCWSISLPLGVLLGKGAF